ncbi:hypothetical protein GCM10010377_48800 [Streptomyces viridiviolaceus]|nr:hypothetical protein GCM10010377_48800 [Streptomyces viridiviolaceus]
MIEQVLHRLGLLGHGRSGRSRQGGRTRSSPRPRLLESGCVRDKTGRAKDDALMSTVQYRFDSITPKAPATAAVDQLCTKATSWTG